MKKVQKNTVLTPLDRCSNPQKSRLEWQKRALLLRVDVFTIFYIKILTFFRF